MSQICPNASALAAFEAAVRRGDITWHAFPHNGEPEMYDASLFDAALNMTFREDDYFGHPHRRTCGTSTPFWTISRAFLSCAPPHARRMMYRTTACL